MSGSDDLRRKLESLSRVDDDLERGWRIISRGGNPTPLQAILREIDETVLTRDLTFRIGQSGAIVLVASGRRLLGVRDIEELAMPMIQAQLAGKPIKGASDPLLRALGGVLMPLDLLTETVAVTSNSVEWSGPETGTGVSVDKLATQLSVEYPFEELSRLGQFRASITDVTSAFVHRLPSAEEVVDGGEADLNWLYANAVPLIATGKPAEGQGMQMTTLGQSEVGQRMLSIAFDGEESLIWVHSSQHLVEISQAWHRVAPH